jgi:hypothetical protein
VLEARPGLPTHWCCWHEGVSAKGGGRHIGSGQSWPLRQEFTCACSASACFFETTRGEQRRGQQAPASMRVNAQSASDWHELSSAAAGVAAGAPACDFA